MAIKKEFVSFYPSFEKNFRDKKLLKLLGLIFPIFRDCHAGRQTVIIAISIFARLVAITLDVVSFAMLLRVILSLIGNMEGTKLHTFLLCITEPFIMPVRFLLAKFNLLQNSMIDWSFTVTLLLLEAIRIFL